MSSSRSTRALPGGSVGFGGNSWADGEVWTQTGETYYGARLRPTARPEAATAVSEATVRRNYREEDAEKIAKKLAVVQMEVEKLKAENEMLKKNHREEMQVRDRKEIAYVCVVAGAVLCYACVALLTRGFV